ncbi:MAG: lysine biosynthesis protein LysX [Candidatus Levybacteria bacterium]|nr:lysine biosynthesis protein LysX [Candidatus Daviesbacteria bacterium]MBI4078837.1 lysine biosynthesis protein LysX [Candidatus Levybacteria bacterium]
MALTLGILHTTIRADEKLLIAAANKQKINTVLVDVRSEVFNPETYKRAFDIALERCVSTVKGMYATRFLESIGIPVVNSSSVAAICEDKFLTSLVLARAGIPTPKFALVFSTAQAIQAVKQLGGFPVVIKPNLGSWGRLLAKINDLDALEAVLEHKEVLGSPQQKAFYIQQYVKKPKGRDIRVFVIDDKTICAIYRNSSHWITNTARGGVATNCSVTKQISSIAAKASKAVSSGVLAMDVFETDSGLTINEINHTMEFKNSEIPTGVSISGEIIKYVRKVAQSL